MKTHLECPETRRERTTKGHRILGSQGGFTIIELMIVVLLIGVLSAVAVPNYVRARSDAQVKACISNLKQINSAKITWSLELSKPETAVPTAADIQSTFLSGRMPECPAGGTYRIRRVSRNAICSHASIGHAVTNLDMDGDPEAD